MKQVERLKSSFATKSFVFDAADALTAMVLGGLVGDAIAKERTNFWPIAIAGAVFLAFQYFRFRDRQHFADTALDELTSVSDNRELRERIKRTQQIYDTISKTIRALNQNTCNAETFTCDDSFWVSMDEVLAPVIENPASILNTVDDRFFVAGYCNYILVRDAEVKSAQGYFETEGLWVFRDDFGIEAQIPDDLMHEKQLSEIAEELKTAVNRSVNFSQFTAYRCQFTAQPKYFVVAPLPSVCDDGGSIGALVIGYDPGGEPCCDLAGVFDILGRLITNWISKYNDCVASRVTSQRAGKLGVQTSSQTPQPEDRIAVATLTTQPK